MIFVCLCHELDKTLIMQLSGPKTNSGESHLCWPMFKLNLAYYFLGWVKWTSGCDLNFICASPAWMDTIVLNLWMICCPRARPACSLEINTFVIKQCSSDNQRSVMLILRRNDIRKYVCDWGLGWVGWMDHSSQLSRSEPTGQVSRPTDSSNKELSQCHH